MFNCCFRRLKRKSSLTILIPEIPVDYVSSSQQVITESVVQDSPPFSPEEILKIRKNLDNLIDFTDLAYDYSQDVISEVYSMLKAGSSPGDNRSSFDKIMSSSYELIGAVPIPGSEVVSWLVGALVETYDVREPSGVDLDKKFADMESRYGEVTLALRKDFTDMHDDPNKYRDTLYTVPFGDKKTITLRELLNYDIPDKYQRVFTDMLDAQRSGLRYYVCKEPFQALRRWGVYYEAKSSSNRGCYPAKRGGNQGWIVHGNMNDWGKGQLIYTNQPLHYIHPEYVEVDIVANSDDPEENFEDGGNRLIQGFPAAVIMPQDQYLNINNERHQGYRQYYILTDYGGPMNFAVADGEFIKWLFIDDGFGNIINPNGVGYRDDIVRNWMINGDGVPDSVFD